MNPSLDDLERLARQAGQILRAGYQKEHHVEYKGAIDLVTEIDHQSEEYLLGQIQQSFPKHRILAEESGGIDGQDEHFWLVDPLDGTVNYAHAIPIFSVSIAYARAGTTQLGTVYDPLRDELFSAERGKGARLNGKTLHVSNAPDLQHSLLVTGFPYDMWTSPVNNLEYFARFSKLTQGVRRLGSAALDLCYVAAGRFDGYWEFALKAWDVAAGGLIAEEAGAKVTSITGGADYLSPPQSVIAAPPKLFEAMLKVLREPQV